MRQIIIAGILFALAYFGPLVLERFMTSWPEWAWRLTSVLCIAGGIVAILLLDPIYLKLKNPQNHPIFTTFIILIFMAIIAGSIWWSFVVPDAKTSKDSVPEITTGQAQENKIKEEKEEIKLLINSAILDIDSLIRENRVYLQFINRMGSTIVEAIHEKTFYDSVKLDNLIKDKLFEKCCLIASASLVIQQRNLRETLKQLNDQDGKPKDRAMALTPYLTTLEIIKYRLETSIQLVNNKITEDEYAEQNNKHFKDLMDNLTKKGIWQKHKFN